MPEVEAGLHPELLLLRQKEQELGSVLAPMEQQLELQLEQQIQQALQSQKHASQQLPYEQHAHAASPGSLQLQTPL